ncbi:MAG: Druantia anti-phage system protein DruA [Anaerolineae bacterium]
MSAQETPVTAPDYHSIKEIEPTFEQLRQLVVERVTALGFSLSEGNILALSETNKGFIRRLHETARRIELAKQQDWLCCYLPRYLQYFSNGNEIIPERIHPTLIEVERGWQRNLFRIARLLWSIPFSKGYGRRLRFLIMDKSNDKLIGILCLQSPPLSFPPRDKLFQYPEGRKTELVNQTMDIQTLGAVPPYNRLLGGKLVALAAASNEVRSAYRRKYTGRVTEIEKRVLPAHLVALTTTSAFGRSSIYNRLRYKGQLIAEPIGYTQGYGSFHLAELYPLFRQFLEAQNISTRGGFGTGPRIKWQTMVRALERLDFSADLLRHGVQREAFLFPLVNNLKAYMEGQTDEPDYLDLPFADLFEHWRERWLLGRAERVDGWRAWGREQIRELLIFANAGE